MPGLLRYTHPGEKPIRTGADRKHTEIQIARFLDWGVHRVEEALAELADIGKGRVAKEAIEQVRRLTGGRLMGMRLMLRVPFGARWRAGCAPARSKSRAGFAAAA